VCGNSGYAGDARVTLLHEKGVIDQLQAHSAPNQSAGAAREQAQRNEAGAEVARALLNFRGRDFMGR
jgi:hypothetical protein